MPDDRLQTLDTALLEAEPQARRLAWLRSRMAALRVRQQALVDEAAARQEIAAREADDVSRVEEGGFVVFLESLMEGGENRLARERAEAQKARLDLEDTQRQLDDLQHARADARLEAEALLGADQNVERLRQAKRELLEELGHPNAARLQSLEQEREIALDQLVELDEALAAGSLAQQAMADLDEALSEAYGLAQLDTFMSGGFLVDMSKRQKLERAHACSMKARSLLGSFDREVADVGQRVAVSIEQIQSDVLMDVVFDNVFTDWSLMSDIQKSLEQTRNGRQQLAERYAELDALRQHVAGRLLVLRQEELELLGPKG